MKSNAEHDLLATVDEFLRAAGFSAVHWQEQNTDAMHTANNYDAAADGPIPALSSHKSVSGNTARSTNSHRKKDVQDSSFSPTSQPGQQSDPSNKTGRHAMTVENRLRSEPPRGGQ